MTAIAIAQFSRGRYEQAAKTARRAVELNPSFSVAQAILTAALGKLGHAKEAKVAAARVLALQPSSTRSVPVPGMALFNPRCQR